MLASLIFSDYRRRVLGLLLLHPDTTYHVRELARLGECIKQAEQLHQLVSAWVATNRPDLL